MNKPQAQQHQKNGADAPPALTLAIAGNPNAGKTTLFNALTGARQHVGNWPGVTVERKEGSFDHHGRPIHVVDLPGTYSLTAYSMEEVIARDYILKESPDVVVNIVDAANLERNLYLTVQLLELGAPVVIALNMVDVAQGRGIHIDHEQLGVLMGVPVVPMVARTGKGRHELMQAVLNPPTPTHLRVNYGRDLEKAIEQLREFMQKNPAADPPRAGLRHSAVKLLENDAIYEKKIPELYGPAILDLRDNRAARIEQRLADDTETLLVDRRYGYISGLIREVVSRPEIDKRTMTDNIDAVLTHRLLGLPFFIFAMWATFQLTFTLGAKPMQWLDMFFGWLGGRFAALLGDTLLGSLVVDGVIGGVGGVLSFLPNILILFFAIAILEDTGYMARAAFIMDKVMHKLHLHGKSFIPLLVGFGCSVPAIMATRTLENDKDRIVTILVAPLMSCGARLPVYVLLAGAFFSPHAAGNVIFSIYIIGILFAVFLARLFRTKLLKGDTTPFVMELPPYRMPTLKSMLLHMWERAWLYIKKAGSTLLGIAIIMWALITFPSTFPGQKSMKQELDRRAAAVQQRASRLGIEPGAAHADPVYNELLEDMHEQEQAISSEHLGHSFAGHIGHFLEPALRPMGFDWKTGIALISGFAAKEVIVSTMGIIYSVGESSDSTNKLADALRADPVFSPLTAYVLMLFTLLTIPCMATVAVILRETRSWKWTAFSLGYHTVLAWAVCFLVYQGGRLIGL